MRRRCEERNECLEGQDPRVLKEKDPHRAERRHRHDTPELQPGHGESQAASGRGRRGSLGPEAGASQPEAS